MAWKISFGVLVSALVGFAIWWSWRPAIELEDLGGVSAPAATAAGVAAAESAEIAGQRTANAVGGGLEGDEQRSVATVVWRVAGRTKRGYGDEPFANATLAIEMFSGYSPGGDPVATVEAKSDASGRFTAAFRPPTGTVTLRVKPAMPDVRESSSDRLVVTGKPAPQNLSIGIYPLDVRLSGRVVDERDRPIPGAYVIARALTKATPCDADGTFALRVSSASTAVTLQCAAPGFAVTRDRVRLPKIGDPDPLVVRLQPALTIRGRVVDGGGLPVVGAKVWTFTTTFFKQQLTGGDGEFVIDYLTPSQARHNLCARKAGFVDGSQQIDASDPKDSYELTLKRGVRVAGIVLGPTGKPFPGAPLYIGFDPAAFDRLDEVSRDDGRFVFPGVRPGRQDLVVEVPGMAPQKIVLDVPADGTAMPEVIVGLEPAHFVAGRVLDSAGKPIDTVWVSARLHEKHNRRRGRYIGTRVRVQDDGEFRVGDLPAGKVDLEFYGTNSIRHVESGVVVDREDVAITLRRAAKLAGTVVDAKTGKPIKSFRIKFIKAGGTGYGVSWFRGKRFDDANGRWLTEHEQFEPNVEFLIEAAATGYGRTIRKMNSMFDPDPATQIFAMHPGQLLRGFVFDRKTSAPVVGARVIMFTSQDPIRRDNRRDLATRLSATTDDTGGFEMRDVPRGELSLLVTHADHPDAVDGPFAIVAGAPTVRRVFLARSARITGTIVDGRGSPIGGAAIMLTLKSGGDSKRTESNVSGVFVFDKNLAPGDYLLKRTANGSADAFVVCEQSCAVASGEEKTVRLEPPGKCTVTGVVRVASGTLPSTMLVMLRMKTSKVRYFSAPVTKGRFDVRGLPAGAYEVVVTWYQSGRILSGKQSAELSPNKPRSVDILLKSNQSK